MQYSHGSLVQEDDVSKIRNHAKRSEIRNIFWWVFVSLVAIGLVETNVLLGLAVATIGGIILGVLLFAK